MDQWLAYSTFILSARVRIPVKEKKYPPPSPSPFKELITMTTHPLFLVIYFQLLKSTVLLKIVVRWSCKPKHKYKHSIDWLIDSLYVGWGTDSYNTKVLDLQQFPTFLLCLAVTWSIPSSILGLGFFWYNYFVFLIIKSGFLFMWSAQPGCGNHQIGWLFKDKSWGQRFAPAGDW